MSENITIIQSVKQKYKSIFYPPEENKVHYFIMDNFRTIVFALTVAMTIRTFIIEPFKIPSTSMVPTLRIGDFLFISKFDYGTKIPFTDTILNQKKMNKGDVIVFDKDIKGTGHKTTYIKRIVATAGDKIEFRDNNLIINGKKLNVKYQDQLTYKDKNEKRTSKRYTEYLNGIKHDIMDDSNIQIPNIAKTTVPAGHVVVMGDNRDRSFDSRLWYYPNWGFVKDTEVRGRALFLFFSWQNFIPRLERIGNSLVPEKI